MFSNAICFEYFQEDKPLNIEMFALKLIIKWLNTGKTASRLNGDFSPKFSAEQNSGPVCGKCLMNICYTNINFYPTEDSPFSLKKDNTRDYKFVFGGHIVLHILYIRFALKLNSVVKLQKSV